MRVLILVDIQNDFVPGGALGVREGNLVVPVANRVQQAFAGAGDVIVATQDWHPPDHGSFAANHPGRSVYDVIDLHGLRQVLWPVHCVQGSPGAAFVADLDVSRVRRIFQKGTDPAIDSYSGFFDNGHRKDTGLGDYLKQQGVRDVYVCGLATDYCVKFTVLDAIQLGFRTHVIEDACRGVNVNPGDADAAVEEMRRAGAKVMQSGDLVGIRR
jgi:nicotinamidase/pyrazinamidase